MAHKSAAESASTTESASTSEAMEACVLERNDVEGALRVYRHAALTGPRSYLEDETACLYMLQDDPDELDRRLGPVMQEPAVAAARLRLGLEA